MHLLLVDQQAGLAFDGAIIRARAGAHVGPLDVAGGIDHDAIRQMSAGDDHLAIRSIRTHGMDTATTARLENEQSLNRRAPAGLGSCPRHECIRHAAPLS